ncbi:hypothetical protein Nmel_000705 [Mimus melanotis]
MDSKLLDENKQPLSENRHFNSFQTSSVSPRTKLGQKDVAGFTSPMGKKELDRQMKEVCLQEPLRRLEEKNEKLIKEKEIILEGSELIIQQEKILKDMQIKINHLHKKLKHPELTGSQSRQRRQYQILSCHHGSLFDEGNLKKLKGIADSNRALGAGSSQEREKVYNCLSAPTQKIAMVKQTRKSGYLKKFCFSLGNSVWLFVRYLLYCICLCLTLLLVYKHLPDPTWAYELYIPDSIFHQPWTH